MNTRTQVIARIEAFIAEADITERQFGLNAVGDHKFLSRLRSGLGVTLTSIEKAERFMDQHGRHPSGRNRTREGAEDSSYRPAAERAVATDDWLGREAG